LKTQITHTGKVIRILNNKIEVGIISKANCISCQLNKSCSASDMKEKIVEIEHFEKVVKVGETVEIVLAQNAGFKALFLGYLFPFIVMFITLLTLSLLDVNELITGLISLFALIPYYLGLYLFRNKIKKEFSFFLHK
jgi:sigma-E factor negative regulatory protein RseC